MFIYFVIVSDVLPITIINIYAHYDQKESDIDINRDIIYDIYIYIYILLIPFISHSSFRRIISTLRTDLCKVGEALLTCAIEGAGS